MSDELRDHVWAELLACYGEGENTDWPWFKDLVDVVVELIGKYGSLAVYVEVAKEHRSSIEAARRIVAMAEHGKQQADALAAALVAVDEAMRGLAGDVGYT